MSNELHLTLEIAAPPGRVFQALVETEQLAQWFAEHAQVSLDDGRYDFWGRMTPGVPEQTPGAQRLLSYTADKSLSFAWQLRGADTIVALELLAESEGTRLALQHTKLPADEDYRYMLTDFWHLALENLRNWVEHGRAGLRPDFSLDPRGSVSVEIDIRAASERVFDVLTDPDELRRYIATDPVVELKPGGRFDYGWKNDGPIKILDLEPGQRLTYQWQNPETVVTWTLEGSGGKTHLTLVHSGFAEDKKIDGYHLGWSKYLNRVKFIAEGSGEFVSAAAS